MAAVPGFPAQRGSTVVLFMQDVLRDRKYQITPKSRTMNIYYRKIDLHGVRISLTVITLASSIEIIISFLKKLFLFA